MTVSEYTSAHPYLMAFSCLWLGLLFLSAVLWKDPPR